MQGTMTATDVATAAQRQYFSRPADERFSSLEDLHRMVHDRRMSALEFDADITDLRARRSDDGTLQLVANGNSMEPTHWAFGQTAGLIGAPAAYLRKLASQGADDLVVQCLNQGIAKRDRDGFKFLAVDAPTGESTTLYATTSPSYGRIWDADVVDMAKQVIDAQDGRFYSPWAWGHKHRALFGSHQDLFM
jgi:hypothetical protein